ncbi:MAG TPA: HD domain-containing protein [Bacilli bacterium]|nr:HD domain-containing protein [Bacilli bacterium]
MSQLLTRMKNSLAKSISQDSLSTTSSKPRITLFCHSYGVLQIVNHMVRVLPEYPVEQATVLRMGAFLHDIGKLHPGFQQMLKFPTATHKWVKHEGQTYRFQPEVEAECDRIAEWIGEEFQCEMRLPDDRSDILACAVTHHGVFYSSLEKGVWQARREWTRMAPDEERRITLADLLIRYYPLGGAVIFADLLHSHQLATGVDHVTPILQSRCQEDWLAYLRERKESLLKDLEGNAADRKTRLPFDLLELLLA